ncbi:MAG: PilZ domain-containing protein [Desulfuromonadales bacterium]|nr:PilZ domain-containing protein [Desulfuromonadales bacterium]
MIDRRKNQRFDDKQDVYLYHGVSKYTGSLDNVSCSGALVKVSSLPQLMQAGDVCHLAFAARPEAILCACTVVRLHATHVGLQFCGTDVQA